MFNMDSAKKKSINQPGERKKPKKITVDYLHNSGLYYLQRFAASRQQFRAVMLRKVKKSCMQHKEQNYEDCAALVEETIKKFERAGLLNDELYTQGVVASLRRQGKSKKVIMMKMKMRGLPDGLVLEKLENHDSEKTENGDLISALIFLRKKKSGPFSAGKDIPAEKTLAALARAGFSYDLSQKVLKMDRAEAENILNA